jgi:hypothetical protein
MIGPVAMNDEIKASDPFATAINELREELLLWIDAELARLQDDVDALRREDAPVLPRTPRPTSSSRPLVVRNAVSHSRPTIARQPTPMRRNDDHDMVVDDAHPPVASREQLIDPGPLPPVPNSRERLDALARMLDRRLKQAHGAAEARSSVNDETKCGWAEKTPLPSRREGHR